MPSQEYQLILDVIEDLTTFNLGEIEQCIENNPAVVNELNNKLFEKAMSKLDDDSPKKHDTTYFKNIQQLCALLLKKGAEPSKYTMDLFTNLLRCAVRPVDYIYEYENLAVEFIKKGFQYKAMGTGLGTEKYLPTEEYVDAEVKSFIYDLDVRYNLCSAKEKMVEINKPIHRSQKENPIVNVDLRNSLYPVKRDVAKINKPIHRSQRVNFIVDVDLDHSSSSTEKRNRPTP